MTVKELESKKENSSFLLTQAIEKKFELESLEIIKEYLNQLKIIENEKEYQKFLDELVVGEDGTIFSKCCDIVDKSSSNLHFGLSKTLNYALGFIQRYNYEEYYNYSGKFRISYEDFQKYLDNAIGILNDMRCYNDDRLVNNNYGLEIYENPMNYSIVDFRELTPMDDKKFRMNYNMSSIMAGVNCFVTLDKFAILDKDIEKLTDREFEAFFGEKAQQILGYSKPKVLRKK